MMELRLTDNTQQAISENLPLSPEALAKLNYALSLSGATHAVESLQTHCELSTEDAETLAVALHLLSKVQFTDTMINKPRPNTTGPQSANTLYIRNLPLNITPEELQQAFDHYGTVKEIRTQKEKTTGEFFGSVFVEYVHASAAKLAQVSMDGKLWGINTVYVSFAKEKSNGASNAGGEGSVVSSTPSASSAASSGNSPSIFVAGLSPDTDAPALKQIFARFGDIADARLLTDKVTGQSKGVGFVDFVSPLSAAAAIDVMNDQIHNGRNLKVSQASQKTKGGNQQQQTGALSGYPPFAATGGYGETPYMGYPQMSMGMRSYY
jgi:RNA recognition motif-containing protein